MRYFIRCQYNGTRFNGWQRQPDISTTIQETIEEAISLVTRKKVAIVGCGRTDTGVHASEYYFHFDSDFNDKELLLYKINQIVPRDISFTNIRVVDETAHARFDATRRGYTYHMTCNNDPFHQETKYVHFKAEDLSLSKLNEAARILIGTHDFEAFCKAHTDVNTKICIVEISEWKKTGDGYLYTVRADRFLRGMIRLIVGMCINVSRGKLAIEEVEEALKNKKRLSLDWSVPAKGLFLDKVEYLYPVV